MSSDNPEEQPNAEEKPQENTEAAAVDNAEASAEGGDVENKDKAATEDSAGVSEPEEVLVEADLVIKSGGERVDPKVSDLKIKLHNFRNSVFLTESEMRQLMLIYENFSNYAASRYSMYLKMDFEIAMKDLKSMPYHEFTEEIANPSFISILRVDPINGVGVVAMDPVMAMTLVDRMLGGKGAAPDEERTLTQIEEGLMQEILHMMFEEWCRQWEDVQELRAVILGHESNARFLQTSERDAVVMVFKAEMTVGEVSSPLVISFPFTTLEPLVKKLNEEKKSYAQSVQFKEPGKWRTAYDDIQVPVYAEWNACEVSVKDFLNLRKGDILELPLDIMQRTHLRFENTTRYQGEVGVHENRVAVRITRAIEE